MLIVCLWLFVAVDVALRLLGALTGCKYICVFVCVAVRVCSECRLCVLGRQALQLQRGIVLGLFNRSVGWGLHSRDFSLRCHV